MDELRTHLEAEIAKYYRLGTGNYFAAYASYLTAVLASFFAALSIATDLFAKPTLAILTVLPGAVLLLNNVFRFEEKARWHWHRHYLLRLRDLLAQLIFEGCPAADVSDRMRSIILETESHYPAFGGTATRPQRERHQ
jgi:hypothetical protein